MARLMQLACFAVLVVLAAAAVQIADPDLDDLDGAEQKHGAVGGRGGDDDGAVDDGQHVPKPNAAKVSRQKEEVVGARRAKRRAAPPTRRPHDKTEATPTPPPETLDPLRVGLLAGPEVIPMQIFTIWKEERPPQPARAVDSNWRLEEPLFRRRMVTLDECKQLAKRFPDLLERYEQLPLEVMKSQVCRILVLYYYGGIYMDLDVAHVRPLSEWFNISSEIVFGAEAGSLENPDRLASWFLAAKPHHFCLRRVLFEMHRRMRDVASAVKHTQDYVGNLVGPDAITQGMKGCASPSLTPDQVTNEYIKHLYAAQTWQKNKHYDSWVKRKEELDSWRTVAIPQTRLLFSTAFPLLPDAAAVNEQWLKEEPFVEVRVFTDHECRHALRSIVPDLADRLYTMPWAVRRDICGPVMVYDQGGIFMHLEVGWKQPLEVWLDANQEVIVAHGSRDPDPFNTTLINWFFAGRAKNVCMRNVLLLMNERTKDVNFSVAINDAARYDVTGAGAFTEGLRNCATPSLAYDAVMGNLSYTPPRSDFTSGPEVIPRSIYLVWKNNTLFDDAAALDTVWRREEPEFTRRVVNDTECLHLASRFPGLYDKFVNLPLPVMRADTCRVLVVYFYGGIYMDLDVAWVRPFSEWFNISNDIGIGYETNNHKSYSNWFFAAKPLHPCFKRLLDLIVLRAEHSKEEAETNFHFVHYISGPWAFTTGMRGCAAPEYSSTDLVRGKIWHQYGSQVWKDNAAYPSWTRDRFARFIGSTWKHRIVITPHPDGEIPLWARGTFENWTVFEPKLKQLVITDSQCQALAQPYPAIAAKYAQMPFFARSSVCRVLAVHHHGGIYMDLTMKFRKYLADWVDLEDDIVLGLAGTDVFHENVANWFFCAQPKHRCLSRVLQRIDERMSVTSTDDLWNEELFMYNAGIWAFTDGMLGCVRPSLSMNDISKEGIIREVAEKYSRKDERVPRQFFVFGPLNNTIERTWAFEERGVPRTYVNFTGCQNVADFYNVGPWYRDKLADAADKTALCKILMVYRYGGIAVDSSSQWELPLVEWLDLRKDLILGNRSLLLGLATSTFVSGRRRHPCLRSALRSLKPASLTMPLFDAVEMHCRSPF